MTQKLITVFALVALVATGLAFGTVKDDSTVNAVIHPLGVDWTKAQSARCTYECEPGLPCVAPLGCMLIVSVPAKACDDAVDCAKAIKDSCASTGDGVDSVDFDKNRGDCNGKCDDGSSVVVICD